jgi:hypothetical protein
METQIQKKVNHDSMWLKATLPSGGYFKFTVNRSGEKLEMAFSPDNAIAKRQSRVFMDYMKLRKGETNQDRFNRLEELAKISYSGANLLNRMQL